MRFFRTKIGLVVVVGLLVGGAFYAGYFLGEQNIPGIEGATELVNKEEGKPENVDFSPFWKAWNTINQKFVSTRTDGEEPASTQEKVWGAIIGLTDSLGDPYTQFLPPKENTLFEESINGEFGGVGMEIGSRDGELVVIAPLKGTPAERAGVESGDKILEIDGVPSANMPVDEAVQKIRGEIGTTVNLLLLKEGESEPVSVSIERDQIQIPTIETKTEEGVFIISLFSFNAQSAGLFQEALREFSESDTDKLIIDLRGNPGGFLEAATEMASWFLDSGKIVVIEDFAGKEPSNEHRSKGYDAFNDNLRLVVLIDEGSASASEILAGALKDHDKALIVGSRSFGKGSVQQLVDITKDTSLKVTIAKWLTPDGSSISEGGIAPDVEISFEPDKFVEGIDTQLQKAIEVIKSPDFFNMLNN